MNIAGRLAVRAREHPDKLAVIERGRTCTFAQLDADVDRLAAGLSNVGIGRGARTVLMVKPGVDFFALTFALFRAGAIPVLVDPGMGLRHLGACLAEAEPHAFIGLPLAHVARIACGWAPSAKVLVTLGHHWLWGGHTVDELREGRTVPAAQGPTTAADVESKDIAAILFTSGSTGVPKGAVYTHRMFEAQVDMLVRDFGMGPADVDVPTFPLFALFDAALGATAVIPRMDFTRPAKVDPREILACVRDHGATQMFGSPALLDRVGRYGREHREKLPTLRRVISAGAPVPPVAMERFATMLSPEARIFTPYGATEALPVARISHVEVLGETREASARGAGTCVGSPLPGMDVKIIRITDDPIERWSPDLELPAGQVGEIAVRGPVVSAGYWRRERSTALAKIAAEGGAWHRMGDLGYRDAQGRLWFCGRKSHRVQTAEGTLYTIPCEAIFNQHLRVKRSALVGVGEEGRKQPVICVELEPEPGRRPVHATVRSELLALGAAHAHTRGIREILFHDSFPVDVRHNSKIFREKLAAWATGRVER